MTGLFRVVIVTVCVLAFAAAGTAAAAERFEQSATPTPVPSSASPTPVPCVAQPIGIVLTLQNPSPGDTLLSGTEVVINGIAYDTGATTGTGIQSVTLYLGPRDNGGISLGTGLLGQPNPSAPPGSQFANAGFKLTTPRLPSGSGAKSIFVYALSTVGNAEATLEVPIYLNSAPTPVKGQVPTAVLPPPPTCTPIPAPTSTAVAPPAPAPAAPAAAATSTPIGVPTPTPPPAPVPAAPVPAAPVRAAPAAAPTPVAVAPAVAPATATTAPSGGGVPPLVGILILGAGAVIVGGGIALRRSRR